MPTNQLYPYYDLEKQENQYYFACYFNMAMANALNLLNSINKKINTSKPLEDNTRILSHSIFSILTKKDTNKNFPTQVTDTLQLLQKNMPVHLYDIDTALKANHRIKILISLLKNLRDYYSHYQESFSFKKAIDNSLNEIKNIEKNDIKNIFEKIKNNEIKKLEKKLEKKS